MRSCEKISLQEFTMAKQSILRHSERSEESKNQSKVFGYFAYAQYDNKPNKE